MRIFAVIIIGCVVIAVVVWALFLLGDFLKIPWYVSATAILLMFRFLDICISDL
jgi:hypothetical protein